MSFYFDKKGRKYKGRERVCENCGNVETVRISNISTNCNSCSREKLKSFIDPSWDLATYVDSKGNKYKGRVRLCTECGDEKIVRVTIKSDLCKSCRSRDRKSTPKTYLLQNGKKRGAEYRTCTQCKKTRLSRNDTNNSSGLCGSCRASTNGKKWDSVTKEYDMESRAGKYKNVSTAVRSQFKHFRKYCLICEKEGRIVIHHVDKNTQNNDISNLMPLCYSCHAKIHVRLNKGMTHDEAFEDTKGKKNG